MFPLEYVDFWDTLLLVRVDKSLSSGNTEYHHRCPGRIFVYSQDRTLDNENEDDMLENLLGQQSNTSISKHSFGKQSDISSK